MRIALLPRVADNVYRGQKAGLWLLGLVIVPRIAIGLGSIFNGRNGAAVADGIPLDTYSVAAQAQVLSMLAGLGLASFTMGALGIVVLVRYRSLVPAMFTLLLLQQVSRKLMHFALPTELTSAPGGLINNILLGMMIGGLALSLSPRRQAVG